MKAMIKEKMANDYEQFFEDINILTNKFEPFNDFAHEQAYFELKKTQMEEQKNLLNEYLQELDITLMAEFK